MRKKLWLGLAAIVLLLPLAPLCLLCFRPERDRGRECFDLLQEGMSNREATDILEAYGFVHLGGASSGWSMSSHWELAEEGHTIHLWHDFRHDTLTSKELKISSKEDTWHRLRRLWSDLWARFEPQRPPAARPPSYLGR